ncbi:MAG TPA: nucleotidyltransferase [Clostridiaceae bacterium]|nr:nucleotidyltransferase [Clostridiaceae bacterium]
MNKPVLVIMAAGMGSRYGGLKQIDPVGPSEELIIDYSIYDAYKAGFEKVAFVINKNIEKAFRETIGKRIEGKLETEYIYQDINDVPSDFLVPEGRVKPWGTGHAVLSCRKKINSNFAVINADDYYGPSTFKMMYDYLKELKDIKKDTGFQYQYAMVGFIIENTLSEYGHVARGICSIDQNGYLSSIVERTKIKKFDDVVKYYQEGEGWLPIPPGSTVSMNIWGFTPSIFRELENGFSLFLRNNKEKEENILKAEYYLPEAVGNLIAEGKARVKVLKSQERWHGITYAEDKLALKTAIQDMINRGIYPESLW